MLREVVEEVTRSLFETVESALQAKDMRAGGGARCKETAGLVNEDFFGRREFGMDEGSSDVGLDGSEAKDGAEDKHDPNCSPLDNGGPCFKIVNSFLLAVTTSTEAGFKFLDTTIRETLTLESPSGWEDIHLFSTRH